MTTQTVMLVEDEIEIREMLSFALTRAGFDTLCAGSAEEALRLLDGPAPTVIIIDWMLPGASGVELPFRDFSHDILERAPEDVLVLTGTPCGWTDLGTVARLDRWLENHGRPRIEARPPVTA